MADDGTPAPAPAQAPPSAGNEGGGRGQDTVANLRAEAASWRVELRKTEEKARELEARLTESEAKSGKKVEDALRPLQIKIEKYNQRLMDSAVRSELISAGLVDKDLAALVDRIPDAPKVELNDDGEVLHVEKLVAAFKAWKPDYFRASGQPAVAPPPRSTGSAQTPPPNTAPPVTKTVSEMTSAEYKAFKDGHLKTIRNESLRR